MDDDDELDEDDLLRRDIAREVEEAFTDVRYPGDDKLFSSPDIYPAMYMLPTFQGKHWRDVTPVMVRNHEFELNALTPEAFQFYLPCFMIPALLRSSALDHTWMTLFSILTPGRHDPDFLNELVNLLSARQKAAVRRYVELYVQTETSLPDPRKPEAVAFWKRITDGGE